MSAIYAGSLAPKWTFPKTRSIHIIARGMERQSVCRLVARQIVLVAFVVLLHEALEAL